jgi:predicted dinucleotide-binding enzyme/DMSO/TMAO reductase YedYZ heme-binding membrane subunit
MTTGLCKSNSLIAIIGTGTYGTALGKRLINFGFKIIYGSRKPDLAYIHQNFPYDQDCVQISTIEEAWNSSINIVFFAVHARVYESLVNQLIKNNKQETKVVVDVSNRSLEKKDTLKTESSNAEFLQSYFNKYTDKIEVIKAFNNVSSYSMNCEYSSKSNTSINYGNGEMIPIAGNSVIAIEEISRLANQMGFRDCQIGSLNKARKLEQLNDSVFPEWQYPTLFSLAFLTFNLIWYFFYSYFSNAKYSNFSQYLQAFSLLAYLNRVFAFTSINLLTFVYLAGLVAMIYQLFYGTKNKRFPRYLDLWLKSRKYLGLWAFFYATLHLVITLCILTPAYFSPWYKPIVQPKFSINNETGLYNVSPINGFNASGFTLHGELNIITGIIAYFIMCILAVCSINSIGLSLNWSEWTFVQSKCGILCLTFSLVHDVVMYSRFIIEKDVFKYTTKHILTRVKFYTILLPMIVLILRFIFDYFTPLSKRIYDIRNGLYNGKNKSDDDDESKSFIELA